jgi:hypothetical protein
VTWKITPAKASIIAIKYDAYLFPGVDSIIELKAIKPRTIEKLCVTIWVRDKGGVMEKRSSEISAVFLLFVNLYVSK